MDSFSRKKIKVLFAINHLGIGGAEKMVAEEIRAIDKDVFDPFLLTILEHKGPSFKEKVGLPPEKFREFAFKGIFDIHSGLSLYRYLRKEHFDVVITNLFNTNVIVRTVAVVAKVPVILSWEHNVYHTKKQWQIFVDKILSRYTYRILVGAPQVKAFTVAQEGLPADKVEVVLDAIDLVYGEVRNSRNNVLKRYGLPTDSLYVVACGRLVEQKGHTFFIEAARIIRERRGDTNVRFLICGEGSLKDSLSRQIDESGLKDVVYLLGIVPTADFLAMADIFSLISLWEGFSIVLIEAMNAGCAIVASRVSGSVDAIEDGTQGLLVPPRDPQAAAEALLRLIDDASLRGRLGIAAKQKSEDFDIKRQVRKMEQIIQSGLRLS